MKTKQYNLFVLAIFFLSTFFYTIDPLAARTLNQRELEQVRGSTESACFRTQKSSALNRTLSDSQILDYCRCYASTLYPAHMTIEELNSGISILQRSGKQAFLDFVLKGRDINEIAENCANRAIRLR